MKRAFLFLTLFSINATAVEHIPLFIEKYKTQDSDYCAYFHISPDYIEGYDDAVKLGIFKKSSLPNEYSLVPEWKGFVEEKNIEFNAYLNANNGGNLLEYEVRIGCWNPYKIKQFEPNVDENNNNEYLVVYKFFPSELFKKKISNPINSLGPYGKSPNDAPYGGMSEDFIISKSELINRKKTYAYFLDHEYEVLVKTDTDSSKELTHELKKIIFNPKDKKLIDFKIIKQ